MIEATTTPRHHHVQENDDDELDDEENNMNGEHSTDLRDNDDEINDPVSLSCQKVPKKPPKLKKFMNRRFSAIVRLTRPSSLVNRYLVKKH